MPGLWKVCGNSRKDIYFKNLCKCTPKQADPSKRSTPIHELQQSDHESWQNSEDEIDRHIDGGNILCLSFNSIRPSIIKKLETRSVLYLLKISGLCPQILTKEMDYLHHVCLKHYYPDWIIKEIRKKFSTPHHKPRNWSGGKEECLNFCPLYS